MCDKDTCVTDVTCVTRTHVLLALICALEVLIKSQYSGNIHEISNYLIGIVP